jgi:hypothetical protein
MQPSGTQFQACPCALRLDTDPDRPVLHDSKGLAATQGRLVCNHQCVGWRAQGVADNLDRLDLQGSSRPSRSHSQRRNSRSIVANIVSRFLLFEDVTEQSFDKVIAVNFKGAYYSL